ncbi:hypothetical protein E2562_024210 [Oryza meyeriana var. granulata]|uniref:Uncharacterized protein n=1 Tax=Oryza meyeriana var. granulata TaxID=110450 RepID=A0A6G1BZM5_9ORYZ|nr:hypothetical protein E2562_024210 [Oryza meyeriana var. granulata]
MVTVLLWPRRPWHLLALLVAVTLTPPILIADGLAGDRTPLGGAMPSPNTHPSHFSVPFPNKGTMSYRRYKDPGEATLPHPLSPPRKQFFSVVS